jgi:hypothetical protein
VTEIESAAIGFVNGSRSQWAELVRIARNTLPRNLSQTAKVIAKQAGIGRKGVETRLKAINRAMAEGLGDAQLIEMGQEKVVGRYVQGKASERVDEQVPMTWKVEPRLREDVKAEVWRIAQVLGLRTSDQFWEFMLSQMTTWTKEEILHAAGALIDDPNKDRAKG